MSGKLVHLVTVVLVVGCVQASLGDVLDPNLVGWWKFDEGSGDVAADSSGRGRDGELLLGPVWRDDGVRQGCLYFDGANDHVLVRHHDSLNPGTGSFTILLWSNVDPTPGTMGDTTWDLPVGKRDSGTNTIGYYVGAQRTQGGGAGKTGYRFMLGDMDRVRTDTPFVPVPLGEWVFVAAVLDRAQNVQKISVDGGLNWATITPPPGVIAPTMDLTLGWDIGQNNYWFHGQIDDVAMLNRALSNSEVNRIMRKGMTPQLAENVQPKDHAVDVPPDVVLTWAPGLYASTHDVYFGTSSADVGAAGRDNPLDVLVGMDQSDSQYDLGRLVLGQTYFWRVDEVNAAPDSTIFKGEVWSFTVEPVGYALAGEHIAATASSSSSPAEGPANTIGGIGLDAGGLHSMNTSEMWLSGEVAAGESAWILYELDKVYSLYRMLVWNHNAQTESLIGVGIKEAVVEYSLDGSAWTRLGDVQTFAQAPGKDGYASNTTIDFAGAAVKYVRITAVSNWKGLLKQYGLSEVRFLYVPTRARQPEPASDVNDVHPGVTLSWRSGRHAATHNVYLSTDEQAVTDGKAPVVTMSEAGFSPAAINLGQTYYWRVDEVNDAEAIKVWKGAVWSFSTQEFLVVDDFESYTDYSPDKVFQTWIDGWGFSKDEIFPDGNPGNGTGAQVGYLDAPFAEPTIVHSGRQSMPLTYSNAAPLVRSEAERTFDEPQDWTLYGAGALTVYFRGTLDNTGQLYLKINNTKVPYNGDAADISTMVWQPWNIDLSKVSGNLKSVNTLTIGVEGADAAGVLYIDDIRLYPKPPEAQTGTEPDRANLVAYYSLDGNANDGSGNGFNGVLNGGPVYVSGVRGQALQFDGVDDHVLIATQDRLNPRAGDITITCWAYLDPTPGTAGTTNWDLAVAKRETGSKGWYVGADRNQGTATQAGYKFMLGNTAAKRVDTPFVLVPVDQWVFVAAVLDRAQNVHKISVDGGLTWATAVPPAGDIISTKDLTIGYDIGPNNYWFHGNIDDVRIYDKALTNDEIAWIAVH